MNLIDDIADAAAPPKVSVLVATYNAAGLVAETLHSVLAQSFADFELIVVDDCSTDGTLDVVQRFDDPRIRLFQTPRNLGPPAARNLGFAHCRGRYVAPVDQDDLLLEHRLARQVAYLDLHHDTALVATATERLVDGTRTASPEPPRTSPGFLRWAMLVGNPLIWSSVLLRREAVARLGVLNREERRYAEDFDLYHRLGAVGTIARIDEVLTVYRHHAQGASQVHQAAMQASAMRVLEDAYAPILGTGAERAAQAMARHVAGGVPVPDLVTLRLIAAVLQATTQYVKANFAVDSVARGLMATERSVVEQRLVRAALRGGTISPLALHREGLIQSTGTAPGPLLIDTAVGVLRGMQRGRNDTPQGVQLAELY